MPCRSSLRHALLGRAMAAGWFATCLLASGPLPAQVLGVALDGKARMSNGEVEILKTPAPDRVAFYDTAAEPWRPLGEAAVPTSFQGPPSSVAISADRREALVTAFTRTDPERAGAFTANHTMAVIDLAATPLRISQTLTLADCGLELKVAGPRKGGPKTVAAITVTAPSRLATRLGIRLGDDEPTVLAAYGRFRDPDGTSRPGEVLVAGSLFGGLIFEFEQGKLVRMFLGAAAE